MGVGKSEWPGSDHGQDNITCLERGAILRPRLGCKLKCGTADRMLDKDNERVYGDPAITKPNRESSGNGAAIGLRTQTVANYHRFIPQVAFPSVNSKKA